jgi:hypothetical protein
MKEFRVITLFMACLALIAVIWVFVLYTIENPKQTDALIRTDSVAYHELSPVTYHEDPPSPAPKPEFHIRVARYGSAELYVVHFTNDNWRTFDELSLDGDDPDLVLFLTKREAIDFAKRFNSYQECLDQNRRVAEAQQRTLKADTAVLIK